MRVSGFPVCSPYRGSLMTGQYAVKHGLVVNDVPLQPNGPTLGDTFRKAGYETAYIGKWHIYGSPDGKFGRRLAFIPKESRFGFEYWKACECTHDYSRSLYYEGNDPTQRYWDGYDAAAQTRDACDFIQNRAKTSDPYFLIALARSTSRPIRHSARSIQIGVQRKGSEVAPECAAEPDRSGDERLARLLCAHRCAR